jgi:hypothetical protein
MNELLSERYADQLDGVLSCYDRIVITGSLVPLSYAQDYHSAALRVRVLRRAERSSQPRRKRSGQ